MLTYLVLVALLCGGVHARWRSGAQSLDSDLDSLLCSPSKYPGVIIDIHESMEKGAELLDGVWTESLAGCMSGCCSERGCDLALFKDEGTSKTGKNCYYVRCGKLENCVMVHHAAFTTITFLTEETRTGHNRNNDNTPLTVMSSTSPATTAPPTTATPTSIPTPEPTTTVAELDITTGAPPIPLKSDDGGVAPSNQGPTPSSDEDGPSKGSVTSSDGGVTPIESKKVPDKGQGAKGESGKSGKGLKSGDDDCSKYGCDGSGMVAVVVVGVICFAIVLVVVAILMKKIVDDRRKRKFRNVDYLINGMYT